MKLPRYNKSLTKTKHIHALSSTVTHPLLLKFIATKKSTSYFKGVFLENYLILLFNYQLSTYNSNNHTSSGI